MFILAVVVVVIIVFALMPYMTTVLMPRWWAIVLASACWATLATYMLWSLAEARLRPDYRGGRFEGIDDLLWQLMAVYAAIGLGVGLALLFLRRIGWPVWWRGGLILAGLLAPPAVALALNQARLYDHRPPAASCETATFKVRIAQLPLHIAARSSFNIYLGPGVTREAYYLSIPKYVRLLCDRSQDGLQMLQASMVSLGVQSSIYDLSKRVCAPTPPTWAARLCQGLKEKPALVEWPSEINIFDPATFLRLGEFGGSRSTYDESLTAKDLYYAYFVSPTRKTPDGKPFSAKCYAASDGNDYCSTSYPWRDGVFIQYGFHGPRAELDTVSARVEANVERFLSELIDPPPQ